MNAIVEAPAQAMLPAGHDRTQYVGGCDIAAILGLSKWRTPLELFYDKTKPGWRGNTEDDERRARILKRGKRLEPVVIDMLVEEVALKVTRVSTDVAPNRYLDREHPFMAAEVDFEFEVTRELLDMLPDGFIDPKLLGTIQNGEIKTVYPLAAHLWGEEFSEDVPIDYAAQSMHGLGVTGRDLCLYGVLFGADNLTLYVIRRDDETIAGIRKKVVDFWHGHIRAGVAPDPLNMADMKFLLARFNGRPVDLTRAQADLLLRIQAARDRAKAAEDAKEEAEFALADAIRTAWQLDPGVEPEDNAELRLDGAVIGTWKRQRGAYLDQKALRKSHPDVCTLFTRENWYRVFKLKKSA